MAFAMLYPFPHDTAWLFAWPIKPTIMPMILASVYIGGAIAVLGALSVLTAIFLFLFPGGR